MPTVSQILAEFSCKMAFADLSPGVVDAVQRIVHETVGRSFGGVRTHHYGLADGLDIEMGGEPQCRLIGSGRMANVPSAAFLNALAAVALEDGDKAEVHDMIPGVWACAEFVDASGEDVVLAIVLACELALRLGEARSGVGVEGGPQRATRTALATAWSCSRVMQLGVEQTVHALGIAGSRQAALGNVLAGDLAMMKNTVGPMATQAGVRAALLARAGYEGPAHTLGGGEGPGTEALGENWRILSRGVPAVPNTPGGCAAETHMDSTKGELLNPMTPEQLDAKFDAMCGDEVPPAQRQEIRDAIAQLPALSARRFMLLLAFRG